MPRNSSSTAAMALACRCHRHLAPFLFSLSLHSRHATPSNARPSSYPSRSEQWRPSMDAVVSAARVECPHEGCGRFVAYYEASDHKSACLHAPCLCTEPGCGFAAPPSALVAHLSAAHSVPVHRIPCGRPNKIQVPVPCPPRRLIVVTGDDGRHGPVFLLTLSALGAVTVVSVVCVRADTCMLPRYTVKMWANGPPPGPGSAANRKTDTVLADVEAVSSSSPGLVALEDLTSYLMVPPRYLVGPAASKELPLHIRIEKNISS